MGTPRIYALALVAVSDLTLVGGPAMVLVLRRRGVGSTPPVQG